MGRHAVIVCALLALLPLATWGKPMGGKYTGSRALTQVLVPTKDGAGNVSWGREKEGEGRGFRCAVVRSRSWCLGGS